MESLLDTGSSLIGKVTERSPEAPEGHLESRRANRKSSAVDRCPEIVSTASSKCLIEIGSDIAGAGEQACPSPTADHVVRVDQVRGEMLVEVDIFRPGEAWGAWRIYYSDFDDTLLIEHAVPNASNSDGCWEFDDDDDSEMWGYSVEQWTENPVGILSAYIGEEAAKEAAPLVPPYSDGETA